MITNPSNRCPLELVDAVLIQPAHAQRHSALLATGRVWKTHVVSSSHPDQVVVGFGSDPGRELVWTWRTSSSITTSVLRIARDPGSNRHDVSIAGSSASPGFVRVVNGESTPVEVTNLLNDARISRHRVIVDGLEPNTIYHYSLGDGTAEGWQPWKVVKTAPDSSRGARFLYLGDAQTGLEGWGRLLKAAYRQNPDIDCVLLAGDLVDRGNERTNWDHFFLRGAGSSITCRLCRAWETMNISTWGLDFTVHSSSFPATALRESIPTWFTSSSAETRASSCSTAPWRFATPCWRDGKPNGSIGRLVIRRRRGNSLCSTTRFTRRIPGATRRQCAEYWVPIFDKHHVDLVLQGHDHAYQRTYPLHRHRRVDTPGHGTIYVIAVSGDKFVDRATRDYVAVGRSGVSTYQTIEIDSRSNRLTYRARTEDGEIIDEVVIGKPRRLRSQGSLTSTNDSRKIKMNEEFNNPSINDDLHGPSPWKNQSRAASAGG